MNYELILKFSLDADNNNYKCTSEQQLQSTISVTAVVVVVYFHRIQVVPYTSHHIVHTAVPMLYSLRSGLLLLEFSQLNCTICIPFIFHTIFVRYSGCIAV